MITSEKELRDVFGIAEGLSVAKARPSLDSHSRQFISLSPFLVIATSNASGAADISPRGDPPGFVRVIDDRTLLIPDRPGNNRLDTMVNIVENPNVACLFFIPGFEDTLRVAGKAHITLDAALLSSSAIQGKTPKAGIVVTVEQAFIHCAKALRRSKLWQDDYVQDRGIMPSIARIILEQTAAGEVAEEAAAAKDAEVEENYRNEMY
jgi:PPOX class probable FMN-dependent enzyme